MSQLRTEHRESFLGASFDPEGGHRKGNGAWRRNIEWRSAGKRRKWHVCIRGEASRRGGREQAGAKSPPRPGFPQRGCERRVSEHPPRFRRGSRVTLLLHKPPLSRPSSLPLVPTRGAVGSGTGRREDRDSPTAPLSALVPPPPHRAAPGGALANQRGGQGDRALLLADPAEGAPRVPPPRALPPAGWGGCDRCVEATPGAPEPGVGAAMAGSPGSEASLEGVSLGSSEEADLRREGRERRGGEAGGKLAPSSVLLPRGLGVRRGCPGSRPGQRALTPPALSSFRADRFVSLQVRMAGEGGS